MINQTGTSKARWVRWKGNALRLLLAFLAGGVLASVADAQYLPFRFEHIGTDQGLSNQLVTCVLRDRIGFLWVGTESGLNQYDGYRFKHFLASNDDPGGLRDASISTLFEDSHGNLWIGTKAGGLHLFDRRSETFRAFQHDDETGSGLSDNRVYRVFEDAAGALWIGTAGGLDKLVWQATGPESVQITSFRHDPDNPESLSHNRVTSIAQDRSGTLWVGTREGLNRLVSEAPPRFARYFHDPASKTSLHDDEIYALLVDSRDDLWIGAWGGGGLARLSPAERSKPNPAFTRFRVAQATAPGIPPDIVVDMLEDREGNMWFCSGDSGSLFRLSAADRDLPEPMFLELSSDEANSDSLAPGSTVGIWQDQQGILWIAQFEGGLNKLDPRKSVFQIYRHHIGNIPSLPTNLVSSVVEDRDGSIWVGNEAGLTQIVPAPRPFDQPRYIRYSHDPANPASLPSDGITAILFDSKQRLWVGAVNGGLAVRGLNDKSTGFTVYTKDPGNPSALGSNTPLVLLEDSRGTIWVGAYNGLYRVVESEVKGRPLTFVGYHSDPADAATLSNEQVEALAEGPDGAIWIGTADGLNRLDPTTGVVTRYLPDPENPNSLNNPFVEHLLTSASGRLWVATRGGLCSYDTATGAFQRASATTGLATVSVKSLAEDDLGFLWAGTIKGLYRLDPTTGATLVFGKMDGAGSDVWSRGAARRGANGVMYFGGPNGLTVFRARDIAPYAFQPPIVLTELLLANRVQPIRDGSVLPKQIGLLDQIVLKPTDNLFSIEFSALDLTRPDATRYAYKLENLYDDWIETDSQNRRATFTNLPHGEYVFRVKAANASGVWTEEGPALRIVVLPPWWKTWWAQLLFYLTAALVLLAVPFLRVVVLNRQRARLETEVQERTVELRETNEQLVEANRAKSLFLSNMSHELRTPLNAVIGFAQLMERDAGLSKEQHESLGLIQRAGEHLLGLINDVLSISKIEAGKLMLVNQGFNPKRMLQSVEEMLRVRAESKGLRLVFDVDPDVPDAVRGDEGKLRQVLINLIGNAIKFTERGGVALRCTHVDDDRMKFEIEDTGVGIAENEVGTLFEAFVQTESGRTAKEGTGLGLVISRQIVRLMGGDISVRSQLGVGTVFAFEIEVPVSDEEETATERRQVQSLALDQPIPRVLVVDDSHENRLLLAKLLASIGCIVREAANGAEAVEQWDAWRPDLIFMDLRMPVLDGYEATSEIRRRQQESSTPVQCKIVALTASAFEHERGTIIERGADDFVSKPFREETIFEKLATHLGVLYRYKDPEPAASLDDDAMPSAERLATLPKERLSELYEALASGDRVVAAEAAERVAATDAQLARSLAAAIRSYRIDELMTVIESLEPTV